jgi:hypothetical protein
MSRSLSSGAHSRVPLDHAGYRLERHLGAQNVASHSGLRRDDARQVARDTSRRRALMNSESSSVSLDCFAEPVIGRAFARPVGSP